MAIQRSVPFSRSIICAAALASLAPLLLGGTPVAAQATKAAARNVKPPSSKFEKVTPMTRSSDAPSRRFGGGSRVGSGRLRNVCEAGPQALAMISPADNVTVTTSTQPSLMLWVSGSQEERDLEFVLRDSNDEQFYAKLLKLSSKAGLVTLDMSELDDAPNLAKGEDYYAYLSLVCDPNDRSKDMVVEGKVTSVEFEQWVAQGAAAPSSFQANGDSMDPFFQVEQSVEVGLWHDAMVQLNRLRQEGSTAAIRQQAELRWQALLEADMELRAIADETKATMSPLAIADIQELDQF